MAWASGATITGGALATSLSQLFVFGSTDAGKNLVTGTTYTPTLNGTAAYGSDSLGTYVGLTGDGYLSINLADLASIIPDGDQSVFITFTREGTVPNWSPLWEVLDTNGARVLGMQREDGDATLRVIASENVGVSLAVSSITASTEYTLVYTRTGSTRKLFYTGGGGTPLTVPSQTFTANANQSALYIGGWYSGLHYPGRFRAWGRWTRTLSDAEAQDLADDPQAELFAGAIPTAPTGVTAGSVTALSATASWTDASSDETGFKVEYAPSPYSSWTALSGSPTAANATSLATGNVLTDGTSYKFRVASTNANGDSAWVESGVFNTPALTRLRPNADTTVGAWTPSTGSTLFGVIDEAVADDADYITTASATTGKVKVEVSTDPADDTNHSVSIRARATSGTLTVSLVQGHPSETLIKAWTPSLTSSFATYVLTMSSGEAAGITDYSDLYLKFVTT
jgi:hypothetical protein